jgi:hypothetical protein
MRLAVAVELALLLALELLECLDQAVRLHFQAVLDQLIEVVVGEVVRPMLPKLQAQVELEVPVW